MFFQMYEFVSSVEHKIRNLEECWLPTVAIYFSIMEKYTMKVNGYRQLFGNQHSSNYKIDYILLKKNMFSCVTQW